jgi:hypothetical protein
LHGGGEALADVAHQFDSGAGRVDLAQHLGLEFRDLFQLAGAPLCLASATTARSRCVRATFACHANATSPINNAAATAEADATVALFRRTNFRTR